ncbi:MAG: hypothetical protein ABIQ55_08200 [Gemmatimonadaceae bacterium]
MSDDLRTQLQTTLGAAYTLDRELGGGGMSRVFVAREMALGREVVVKDSGTASIGVDSSLRYISQPIAGGLPRPLSKRVRDEWLPSGVASGAVSSDGKRIFFLNSARARWATVVELRLADGAVREVLRFDEAARPHSNASIGIAEHGGWLYFTLSDLQSDIWVAKVTGLKQ